MRKLYALGLLGMTMLFACWLNSRPVLAYKLHASHDLHGSCSRGWCDRERSAQGSIPSRPCTIF
jgi:hypothetical protein